ncbi:LexA family transcriptional regulator [Megalodesulfovibrio paquesii]
MKYLIEFEPFFQRVSQLLGLTSQQDLARALGINRSAITQAKLRNIVPESWVAILSRKHNLSPQWLSLGHGPPSLSAPTAEDELIQIPKVQARLCAGSGSFEVSDAVQEYYAFKSSWLLRKGQPNAMVLMDVFGNSMEPLIVEGDMALIDQSNKQIIAGSIYAIGLEDTVMLKRIERRPGALVLRSDNTDYTPIVLHGEELEHVRVIGKMIWSCREYR